MVVSTLMLNSGGLSLQNIKSFPKKSILNIKLNSQWVFLKVTIETLLESRSKSEIQ